MAKNNPRMARRARHLRVRKKIMGIPQRPRLCVFRSLNHIYAQLIADTAGHTLVAASSLEPEILESIKDKKKSEAAATVGEAIARRALAKGYKEVVFDRGGYLYHGRVKALAEAARKAGLVF